MGACAGSQTGSRTNPIVSKRPPSSLVDTASSINPCTTPRLVRPLCVSFAPTREHPSTLRREHDGRLCYRASSAYGVCESVGATRFELLRTLSPAGHLFSLADAGVLPCLYASTHAAITAFGTTEPASIKANR